MQEQTKARIALLEQSLKALKGWQQRLRKERDELEEDQHLSPLEIEAKARVAWVEATAAVARHVRAENNESGE